MAGLTKQHFKRIAEILNDEFYCEDAVYKYISITEEKKQERADTIRDITISLSNYFKTQNPCFNENQFKKACLK